MSVRPQEPQAHTTRGEPIPHSCPSRVSETEMTLPVIPHSGRALHLRFTSCSRGHFNRQKESHNSISSNDEGYQSTYCDVDGI